MIEQINSRYLSLEERLNLVLPQITSETLLNNQSLGGDIGFHVFDYPADREDTVRDFIATVIEPNLQKSTRKIRFVNVNLFNLIIQLLKGRDLYDRALELQIAKGDESLMKVLAPVLKEDKVADYLIKTYHMDELDVMLLTGIGAAYPLVRLHTLLNALHMHWKNLPLVIFYPGKYDGVSLRLFGLNTERNDANAPYYRAFPLLK